MKNSFFVYSFSTKFESNIKKTSATLQITNGNMTAFLLDTAKTSPREYRVQYLTGASVANGTIYAWFNNQALHSSTLALNLIHNALIQSLLGDDYSIEVSNMPLNNRPRSDTPLRYTDAASLSYGIVSAMSVLSTSYILFYIKVYILQFYFTYFTFYFIEEFCNRKNSAMQDFCSMQVVLMCLFSGVHQLYGIC